MSQRIFNGDHFSTTYNGDGANVTNIQRGNVSIDTPNAVVINSSGGILSSEQFLSPSRGGFGIDSSALTGVPRVNAGVWSVGGVTFSDLSGAPLNHVIISDNITGNLTSEPQLAPSRGGTGINTSSSTGVAKISSGVWSAGLINNADVSNTAAIARSKIAAGVPNGVVVNDIAGLLSSQAVLDVARGGLGDDFSSVGVGPFILTNSGGTISSNITFGTLSTPNSIVQRDALGNINLAAVIATSVDTPVITAPADLTVNVNNFILNSPLVQPADGIPGGNAISSVYSVQTLGAVSADLLTLPTSSGINGTSYTIVGHITGGAPVSDGLLFSFFGRGKNSIGVVSVNPLVMNAQSTDLALNTASISFTTSGADIIVRVNGVAGKNINWCGKFEIILMEF